MRRFCLAILIFLLYGPAWGATYFVDATGGKDSNPGTAPNNAWKTISKVNTSSLFPGDFILFKRGETWRETLTVKGGSAGKPVTYDAYGTGNTPVMTGSDVMVGFTDNGNNIWMKADVTTEPKIVFINNSLGSRQQSITTCTTAGRWFWTGGSLFVYATSNPSGNVEAGQRDYGITAIQIPGYATIKNLTVQHANADGILMWDSGVGNTVQYCVLTYNQRAGLATSTSSDSPPFGWYGLNMTIQNCDISFNGADGINIAGHNDHTMITNNTVHHNCISMDYEYTGGIKVNSSNASGTVVQNNEVYANGYTGATGSRGAGIWFDVRVPGGTVRYNKVYSNNFHGIFLEISHDIGVYYNLVYNNITIGIGGITICGRTDGHAYNNFIYNNVIYSNYEGILVFGDNSNGVVYNNFVKNNISLANKNRQLKTGWGGENDGSNGYGNIYAYNCFGTQSAGFIEWGFGSTKNTYSSWETAYGGNTLSTQKDPIFVNTAGYDFHLLPASPGIKAGTNVSLTRDYDGKSVPIFGPPDVGAFQYEGLVKPSPPNNLRIQ